MDTASQLFAARYVRRQVKQLTGQWQGVRHAEDLEFIHRARVATRRLRAALRLFHDGFPRRKVRRWQKTLRRMTARLGRARDCDVQIEFLCGALSSLVDKECFPAVSRILVRLERQRERLQRPVVRAVNRIESSGVLQSMRRATKRILRTTPTNNTTVDAMAQPRRRILRQLDAMLGHRHCLADPNDRAGHHALRIAMKRLRYTLEIVRPLYCGQLDEAFDGAKQLQTLLGEVHDCDVWCDQLDRFAVSERRRLTSRFGRPDRMSHLQPGLDYLRTDRQRRRDAVFGQLIEICDDLNRRQVWPRLAGLVVAYQPLTPVEPNATASQKPPSNDPRP
ncbi:MAG: CHAD domain-containing protein [Planctomycetaceae bacterium]|nr:CHAD domain-containing protein [Planctomycetaceae bacterium]